MQYVFFFLCLWGAKVWNTFPHRWLLFHKRHGHHHQRYPTQLVKTKIRNGIKWLENILSNSKKLPKAVNKVEKCAAQFTKYILPYIFSVNKARNVAMTTISSSIMNRARFKPRIFWMWIFLSLQSICLFLFDLSIAISCNFFIHVLC